MTTPTPMAPEELPELPLAYEYVYGWTARGHRSLSSNRWNGDRPDTSETVYTADQMRVYARLALAARQEAVPAGFWLAPMEADTEMLESYLAVSGKFMSARTDWNVMRDSWLSRHPAPATQQAASEPTPALKRHALEAAKALSEYAAAPFFPDTEKRGKVRSTTAEWWDGLAEMIEETQPLIARALRECTEPLQQAAGDAERDAAAERVFSTSDDEGFSDDFSSMVDSLLTQHEKLTPGLVYYVGDKREFAPSDFMRGVGGTILEYASDQAWQEVDEWSEDFANGVKPEAMAELQAVVNAWADKHLSVTFWGVKNIREATITEQDVADHSHLWADAATAQADQDTAPKAEKGGV